MVADEPGEVLGVAGVVDAGADEFDGGGGPQGVHALFSPYSDALPVGLQDRDGDQAAGAQVGVQPGQVGDLADVRGLIQHDPHGGVEAAAGGFGAADRGAHDLVDEGGDQRTGGAFVVLGQQVQRVAAGGETVDVEQRSRVAVGRRVG